MMKTKLTVLFTSCTLLLGFSSLSAQVTIGTNEPPKSFSVLEVVSGTTNTGGLRLPQLTDADKTAIETALAADPTNSQGLLIYSITNDQVEYWDGTQWVAAKSGSGGPVTIPDEPWLVSGGSTQATSNSENIYQLGQVTIGNAVSAVSSAALNVDAPNKGVLFPRVALTGDADASTIASPATGLLVYNTGTGGLATAGYYYWNGTKWELAKAVEPWLVLDGTDAGKPASLNNQNIYQMGTVNIGTNTKDDTAILNVFAQNKGVLLPKVPLKSADDKVTITNPTTGLLVYNTGAESTFPVEGYMFWNGTEWRLISTSTSVAPSATLVCGQATLDPEQVIQAGVPLAAGTVLRIPYTVGNGGMYNAAILSSDDPTSDITATISSGLFENGSGYLAFNVTGTPTANQETPTGITFNLQPFFDANPTLDPMDAQCKTITVGTEIKADIKSVATMDNLKLVDDGGVEGYGVQLTSPDGKFSVRAFIVSDDFDATAANFGTDSYTGMNLQIRNNTASDVVIAGQFNWQWGGSGGNGANRLGLQPNLWSGDSEQNIDNASTVYWANYVSDDRGTGYNQVPGAPTTTNKSNKGHFVYWGNNGIYANGRPERRTYSWTTNDGVAGKTAYILTFSSSALTPDQVANATNCPNGICGGTKIFMMLDQITAP
jgi:hypothetical protein